MAGVRAASDPDEHSAAQDAARSQLDEAKAAHARDVVAAEERHKAVAANLSALQEQHSQSERNRAELDRKAQSLSEDLQAKHRELDVAQRFGATEDAAVRAVSSAKDEALAKVNAASLWWFTTTTGNHHRWSSKVPCHLA